jgi:cyclase
MKEEAEKYGPIRYIINTEHHIDHIFGNYFFNGAGIVISHIEVYNNFMEVTPALNPYHYAKEAIPTDDPEGEALFPDEEAYFKDPNKPTITFEGELIVRVGGHTFELTSTPGHTPGQIAVYIPEERVAFVGDTIFNQCQTWHMESDLNQWLKSLDLLKTLDVDYIIPGHGPVCTKKEIDVQKAFLYEWISAVARGIANGWSKEECVSRINFLDRFPVDIGQGYMADFVNSNNVATLYEKLVASKNEI